LQPGKYASRQRFGSLAKLSISPSETATETVSLVLHDVVVKDGATQVSNTTCAISQPSSNGVTTSFSAAFTQAIPVTTITASTENATAPTAITFTPDVVVLGATLANPETDSLPSDSSDSRVTDSDKDGHPGVTVNLSGFITSDVYVVQRNVGGLMGTLGPDGAIRDGRMTGDSQQEILGYSNGLLSSFSMTSRKNPDPSKSSFIFVPVAATATCADVVSQETSLFGAR
jgi:hypothetical protein